MEDRVIARYEQQCVLPSDSKGTKFWKLTKHVFRDVITLFIAESYYANVRRTYNRLQRRTDSCQADSILYNVHGKEDQAASSNSNKEDVRNDVTSSVKLIDASNRNTDNVVEAPASELKVVTAQSIPRPGSYAKISDTRSQDEVVSDDVRKILGSNTSLDVVAKMNVSSYSRHLSSATGICRQGRLLASEEDAALNQARCIEVVVTNRVCFAIPNTLELQAGLYKKLSKDAKKKILNCDEMDKEIVVQQAGLNSGDSDAFKDYFRLIYKYAEDTSLKDVPLDSLSPDELRIYGDMMRQQLEEGFRTYSRAGTIQHLSRWIGASYVDLGNRKAIKCAYIRRLNSNPEVRCDVYTVNDGIKVHTVNVSYRVKDERKWGGVVKDVLKSFKFD